MSAVVPGRVRLEAETASAVEDALSYYLTASSDNFGAGWSGEDDETIRRAVRDRELVAAFLKRVQGIRQRLDALNPS